MYVSQPPRAVSAASSALLTAGILAVLIFGFGPARTAEAVPALLSVEFADPPPPKPKQKAAERKTDRKAAPKDEAGRRNLKNEATAIVAPPVVPLIVPPPVVTAPVAATGSAPQTGAAPLPGPGQGAGTRGDGLGGGGLGGDGDGTGDGMAVKGPRRISGRMAFADLPEGVLALGEEASVRVIYTVEADGRVTQCRSDRPSGYPAIDSLTCRLIEQRFRFRPAVDRRGRPVASQVRETHSWYARDS
ncbi:Gram-negative bacterial tonB protein [Tsuneonella dongtanensis]|uniref:Gram-negative bacterial tonB protein n=1 Tax=Tsuneonella dongtanensis TaxID=692370 RepID=A0A1B2AEG6_9SPHN|nr:TonB family protein [Tsuneonella dongtanensis]ANY20534.1 Gram-negative bacterial tonB protein [Tsuneonella dongtanensis]